MRVNRVQGSYLRASKSCDVVGGVLLNIRERTRPGLENLQDHPLAAHRARATIEQGVPQPQSAREIGSARCRIEGSPDDPYVSAGYGRGSWNDQDLIAAVNGLEEKSPNAPASEGRQRTFPPEAPFPDLPDGIARSRLVNGEYVRERDEHVFSGTSGVR